MSRKRMFLSLWAFFAGLFVLILAFKGFEPDGNSVAAWAGVAAAVLGPSCVLAYFGSISLPQPDDLPDK